MDILSPATLKLLRDPVIRAAVQTAISTRRDTTAVTSTGTVVRIIKIS